MPETIEQFHSVLSEMGSTVVIHREVAGDVECSCRTPEGFRDPAWHHVNDDEPVCNELGFLSATVTEYTVKASIQPAIARLRTRAAQRIDDMLGDVKKDDHVGIFPCQWGGHTIDFYDWSEAGDEYVVYDGRRFIVVAADKIPDVSGNANHHWEVGLRLVRNERPNDA